MKGILVMKVVLGSDTRRLALLAVEGLGDVVFLSLESIGQVVLLDDKVMASNVLPPVFGGFFDKRF